MSTSPSTAMYAFMVALETAARAAIVAAEPTAKVTYEWGEPDTWADDCVLLMDTEAGQAAATMGTNRSREETLTCDVHVVSSRRLSRDAGARAYYLLGLIERQCRMVDPTLGGVVRQCVLTRHESTPFTLDDDRTGRRGREIRATFTAQVRVTG